MSIELIASSTTRIVLQESLLAEYFESRHALKFYKGLRSSLDVDALGRITHAAIDATYGGASLIMSRYLSMFNSLHKVYLEARLPGALEMYIGWQTTGQHRDLKMDFINLTAEELGRLVGKRGSHGIDWAEAVNAALAVGITVVVSKH
jgi:hypothetical protein